MVRLDKAEIDEHIAVLEEFEQKYSEFLSVRHDAMMENKNRWSEAEWAERSRNLTALSTRADAAMKASPVGQLLITHPPALGGGVKSADLPSQIFDFQDGFMNAGDGLQQKILARIPSQIEGLKMLREKAAQPKRPRKSRAQDDASWWHDPNPWALTIIGGLIVAVAAGVILWLILGRG